MTSSAVDERFLGQSGSTCGPLIPSCAGSCFMLVIFLDMVVLWFLLNMFSEESWDDQKLKIFGIALAISILGGVAASFAVEYVGTIPAIGAYFLVGTLCLWGLANLSFQRSLAAMGVFFGLKVAFVIGVAVLFAGAVR